MSFHLHIIQIQHIQADWVSSYILQSFYKTYVTMKVIPDYGVMLIYVQSPKIKTDKECVGIFCNKMFRQILNIAFID